MRTGCGVCGERDTTGPRARGAQAANYMDIKPLLDLTCAKVASMIKGRTPEEIRKVFNIVNDFTPEEEAQVCWGACVRVTEGGVGVCVVVVGCVCVCVRVSVCGRGSGWGGPVGALRCARRTSGVRSPERRARHCLSRLPYGYMCKFEGVVCELQTRQGARASRQPEPCAPERHNALRNPVLHLHTPATQRHVVAAGRGGSHAHRTSSFITSESMPSRHAMSLPAAPHAP